MGGLLCFGVPLLMACGLIVMALVRGIGLVRESNQRTGSAKTTLRLLALNMIEPAVNTIVMGLLFINDKSPAFLLFRMMDWDGLGSSIVNTLPVAVLLLPFFWVRSSDAVCATINTKLGLLGIVRWFVTAVTFVFPPAVLIGIGVLWFSYSWVPKQASKLIRYQAIGVGPDGVMVGDLSDFSAYKYPDIRV